MTQSGSLLPYPGQGYIYLFEDSGLYKELQVITSVNTRVNSHIALNGYWAWSDDNSNNSGIPSNQYNTSQDWGRAAQPANRINLFGTLGLPLGVTASPIFSANSSSRFNITDGFDYNGDGVSNDRPAFAPAGAACTGTIRCTAFGNFNIAPGINATPIPVNYGNGPSQWRVDMRFTRSFVGKRRRVPRARLRAVAVDSADLVVADPLPAAVVAVDVAPVAVVASVVVAGSAVDSVRWAAPATSTPSA